MHVTKQTAVNISVMSMVVMGKSHVIGKKPKQRVAQKDGIQEIPTTSMK